MMCLRDAFQVLGKGQGRNGKEKKLSLHGPDLSRKVCRLTLLCMLSCNECSRY